jgi:hypothetical protein
MVADTETIKLFGYCHDQHLQPGREDGEASEQVLPCLLVTHNINDRGSQTQTVIGANANYTEQIEYVSFLSDLDPSFLLVLTYSKERDCSFLKILKVYNKQENEEDWGSDQGNQVVNEEGRTFSFCEEDRRREFVTNLKSNLEQEPFCHKKNKNQYEQDNI